MEEKNEILCTCKNLYGIQTNLEAFQPQRVTQDDNLSRCIEFIDFKLLSKDWDLLLKIERGRGRQIKLTQGERVAVFARNSQETGFKLSD